MKKLTFRKYVKPSAKLKALEADIPMGLKVSSARASMLVEYVAFVLSVITTEILSKLTVSQLKSLLVTLHTATSLMAEELGKRTG
jgi:hypothetical protein